MADSGDPLDIDAETPKQAETLAKAARPGAYIRNIKVVKEKVDADDGDDEACVVCDMHLEAGDLVYWSANDDGHMHAECATSYVDEDGHDTDTPPKPFEFRPDCAGRPSRRR